MFPTTRITLNGRPELMQLSLMSVQLIVIMVVTHRLFASFAFTTPSKNHKTELLNFFIVLGWLQIV